MLYLLEYILIFFWEIVWIGFENLLAEQKLLKSHKMTNEYDNTGFSLFTSANSWS